MGCSVGDDGEAPAVLQLHRWDSSRFNFNLSEYREAFISPTRELVLLLSHQREALLLPLLTVDPRNDNILNNCSDERLQNQPSAGFCFQSTREPLVSDLKDDVPCTSSVSDNDDFSCRHKFSRYDSYPFICEVNSLAWGGFGDTYNQHKEILFREVLFVCSSYGVVVHAFCRSGDTDEKTRPHGELLRGRWVDWGPSSMSPFNFKGQDFSLSSKAAGTTVFGGGNTDGETQSEPDICKETLADELSGAVASKRWLRSFLTDVETSECDGSMWTRFPKKSSFPSSAEVVSFRIFDSDFSLKDFLTPGNLDENVEGLHGTAFNNQNNAVVNSSDGSVVTSYKCFRVFSSNSFHLIGFALALVDSVSTVTGAEGETNRKKNILLVARLDNSGIQWVSLVKLVKGVNTDSMSEWADFCFSDKLLVCLNSDGLVYFYKAMSGEFVAFIDVLHDCSLKPQTNLLKDESLSVVIGSRIKRVDEVDIQSTSQCGDFLGVKKFKKLLIASHTSLLAAVDEHGVIYVVSAGGYFLDYNTSEKLFPYLPHLGQGILDGWEIGGSDIARRREYSNSIRNGNLVPSNYAGNKMLWTTRHCNLHTEKGRCDMSLSGFSATSGIGSYLLSESGTHSLPIRKLYLPIERSHEDDYICFSTMGITRLIKKHDITGKSPSRIVHFNLHIDSAVFDDRVLNSGSVIYPQGMKDTVVGEAVGCTFQGCLYLVTEVGVSVVLPSISVSSEFLPVEAIGYRIYTNMGASGKANRTLEIKETGEIFSPWKVEVLDRVLLYEGPEEAAQLCLKNGWDLKISKLRRLQMALHFMMFDEIEKSLQMLVGVNLAEEGILRLLFPAVYLMFQTNGNDSDASAASRLLNFASCFATKVIRNYGFLQHKKWSYELHGLRRTHLLSLPLVLPDELQNEMGDSRGLRDMAKFLEIIRNLQHRLAIKLKNRSLGVVVGGESLGLVDTNLLEDESHLSTLSANVSSEMLNQHELSIPASSVVSTNEAHTLISRDSLDLKSHQDMEDPSESFALVPHDSNIGEKNFPLENPKEMIGRWRSDNLDLKTVVKDALLSGRLPLAVLQIHLYHAGDLDTKKESLDSFTEVRDIGRAIAYDLFLKGETGVAVATLQRLGEDIETCLKQLLFGTVRRSLRIQVADEISRYGYLGPYEWKTLEKILLIERLYPSSSFWRTFTGRQKALQRGTLTSSSPGPMKLQLLCQHSHQSDFAIECGEIDGVVLGSWTSINESFPDPGIDENTASAGYWAAAAVWSSAWDQRTIDCIVLDQPYQMGVNVLWESQLAYHLLHHDWVEVFKLLDLIPASVLSEGSLQITMDGLQHTPAIGCFNKFTEYDNYICSIEELDAVCMEVPAVKIIRFSVNLTCSTWLRTLMEQELAKKYIFLKERWEGTGEIVAVLARSGFITGRCDETLKDYSVNFLSYLHVLDHEKSNSNMVNAFHKLIIHHSVQYNLPYLLDVYLDHHKLVLDNDSLRSLLEAAGDCQWARWLLFSRIKGCEYNASFSNARAIMSANTIPDSHLSVPDIEEIIHTVDDIAEGGGEMAALATLMYASDPIQDCLNSGSISRHSSSSCQCTLENLKPTLQRFPTLWRTLVAASSGKDITSNFFSSKSNDALALYLNWRDNIFFSTSRDTSLLQMLPCWFPKTVRRLIQLYIQGPLGWQSLPALPIGDSLLHKDLDLYIHADEHTDINAVSWEATIQKHVQEELYDSSLEETELGIDHHLHRGRALAAFSHILGVRVQKLKLEDHSISLTRGQSNAQSDVQTLLAPLRESEVTLISSAIPLAITHFEDSVLVASCAFLLELCGLSASMLRVDVAALTRISSFYKYSETNEKLNQFSPKGSSLHMVPHESDMVVSLARSLADEYLHKNSMSNFKLKAGSNSTTSKQFSRALMLTLQHLEKASLPLMDGKTCGSWLLTGVGDGAELRSQQKAASQHWNLVTVFCLMHQLPLSTKYLAVLARDNDWVGFLSEAQIGGYPYDTVVQVATKEFTDPRLRIHILTVLKDMQSRKKAGLPAFVDNAEKGNEPSCTHDNILIPAELFRILADCEKQKKPGESLLKKSKEMSWSILAMIASCFPDVSPLSCLTVWLEITAARETSSIKVNDIASQIADNVGAAVEATNSQLVGGRGPTFHYNRQNPKRRRLVEPLVIDSSNVTVDVSTINRVARTSMAEGVMARAERKLGIFEYVNGPIDSDGGFMSLTKMVAVLSEQRLFLPLLRAFEMFLPSSSLLPFIRALQAFSQMRLSESAAHLGSFSSRIKDEPSSFPLNVGREGQIGTSWISSMAIKAANAMLATCPSPYERRCLLQLLSATDFGDGGSAASHYRRLYWKINLAEPLLRKDVGLHLGNEVLDDSSLLKELEKNGHWEQARNWARQLEATGGPWKSAVHHVTETQAESMVAEWKEFLWDVPEERVALWGHCQTLFIRYSFPPLQAGLFFLKHAEAVEKDLPARELQELLLLSLQWLSGMITITSPVYPVHLLREIETRVWLLAVESETQIKSDGDFTATSSSRDNAVGSSSNIIDRTASLIMKMDNHINSMGNRSAEKHDARENNFSHHRNQVSDSSIPTKAKRRTKGYVHSRQPLMDSVDKSIDPDDGSASLISRNDFQLQDENFQMEMSLSKWEERVGFADLERAVLSLLEFGQISAAKQLQQKLSPSQRPPEFVLVDAAIKLASLSTPSVRVSKSILDEEVCSVVETCNAFTEQHMVEPLQVLENLTTNFTEGNGRGLCKRIIAVVKAANVLGLSFSEAFDKQPIELLQLLSLKAQESFEEACFLVQTHSMPASSIAQILAESFLKGLLAAHRGGYMESQKEEGPSPLLWRFSDFLKWAELCSSEPEIGHALMRLVITGQEIPHACEVELLILSHHFYKSSACLDGVDVLVALAATRVEAYVSEGDFPCLARLITGVGNFHALNFILGILIENGQLNLLLQKYSVAADINAGTAEAIRGFRMAVITALKHFNPKDHDAFATVYNHFDMKHETAALLESRAWQSSAQWFHRYDNDQNEDLLESMRYFIEAAEVHSSVDAGNKTRRACAQASLVSLQIRMPDSKWLNLSETNARRLLVEQSRFQEAIIVAEAYGLNQPSEWALVLWNQMLKPELTKEFVAEFVGVLPLQPSMLVELARFYRAEVAARGDQSQFSVWLTGGGLPAEWAKYLGRSFRCLLKRTRDLRLRLQLATIATGFSDVSDMCTKALDKVPENAGPLVLRKGHGGAYLPLM